MHVVPISKCLFLLSMLCQVVSRSNSSVHLDVVPTGRRNPLTSSDVGKVLTISAATDTHPSIEDTSPAATYSETSIEEEKKKKNVAKSMFISWRLFKKDHRGWRRKGCKFSKARCKAEVPFQTMTLKTGDPTICPETLTKPCLKLATLSALGPQTLNMIGVNFGKGSSVVVSDVTGTNKARPRNKNKTDNENKDSRSNKHNKRKNKNNKKTKSRKRDNRIPLPLLDR